MKFFQYGNEGYKSILDPRTKLLLLIVINVVIIGTGFTGTDYVLRVICAVIPFVLFLMIRRFRTALLYALVCGFMLLAERFLFPSTHGVLNLIIVITLGPFSRILVGYAFAYYMMCSTTVSEFVTAMKRMRVPDAISIPLSVMFRFFPTLAEENRAIRDAMRLRGIRLTGKNGGLLRQIEYEVVPLMMSTLRIGDELSAASLTKGLNAGRPRTHICHVKMEIWDWALVLLSLGFLFYMLVLR
ncbi:MAG: energy-coupling factor transporter transmembrane protein EcfT [Oscillospiraceae bacterium]|nr:energy-coupling factor transporter transmembrane protein EcfT [Oscillospiraceae bacterium]